MAFEVLRSHDPRVYDEIIRLSDAILEVTLESEKAEAELWARYQGRGDWYGTGGYCNESSDAVTRAAHSLGIVASREKLADSHSITSFAPLDQMPSEEDLILCRTWGQFDSGLYEGSGPYSWKPFFGRRQELAALLVGTTIAFRPESVIHRQVVHAPGLRPNMMRVWLETTPEEIVSGRYQIGESTESAHPGRNWS